MTESSAAPHGVAGATIADDLRRAILAGEYEPGMRIRQEELAERQGASRLPVREALKILEGEGLVTVVPNTGAWVSSLSLSDCEEMYQIRERIEPLLLRYNLPLLLDSADDLERLASRMEETDDLEEFIALDSAFHLSTYDVAETAVLGETVVRLWNRTHHYRRAFMRVRGMGDRSIHHEHHLLVSAVRRQDPDDAERILAGHIRRTRLELTRHPEVFS